MSKRVSNPNENDEHINKKLKPDIEEKKEDHNDKEESSNKDDNTKGFIEFYIVSNEGFFSLLLLAVEDTYRTVKIQHQQIENFVAVTTHQVRDILPYGHILDAIESYHDLILTAAQQAGFYNETLRTSALDTLLTLRQVIAEQYTLRGMVYPNDPIILRSNILLKLRDEIIDKSYYNSPQGLAGRNP